MYINLKMHSDTKCLHYVLDDKPGEQIHLHWFKEGHEAFIETRSLVYKSFIETVIWSKIISQMCTKKLLQM